MANRHTQNRRPRIPSLLINNVKQQRAFDLKTQDDHDPKLGPGDPSRPPARRRQSKERCRSCTDPPKRERRLSATGPVAVSSSPSERPYLGAGPCVVQCQTPDSQSFLGITCGLVDHLAVARRPAREGRALEAPKPAFPAAHQPLRPWSDRMARPLARGSASPGKPGGHGAEP